LANSADARILQVNNETVAAGLYAARQFGAKLEIIEALIHVGQHGALRTDARDP
jgi:hypothetical protein